MKKKQSQPITDEMLYQMGVYFPPEATASESFSRKTDFLKGGRIISLKRESSYKAMLPKLNIPLPLSGTLATIVSWTSVRNGQKSLSRI